MFINLYFRLFLLIIFFINSSFLLSCNRENKCVYHISRLNENEYLMVKNILVNLYDRHWNITGLYLNFFFDSRLKECDRSFDFKAVKQVINKDYRHPNSLFLRVPLDKVNKTVKLQYEMDWLEKYKMIKYGLQTFKYVDQCNEIGLKLFYLIHEYPMHYRREIFKCSSGHEETVSNLIDYYIAQIFLKGCDGNLEMLAHGIYKLLQFDCSRAFRLKLAYFNSKYLNLIRVCDPELTVTDLVNKREFANCTAVTTKFDCAWYEIVCKFPETCLKSMKWSTD